MTAIPERDCFNLRSVDATRSAERRARRYAQCFTRAEPEPLPFSFPPANPADSPQARG